MDDLISRQAAIDAVNSLIDRFERLLSDIRESRVDDSVCGLCEYDGAFIGQSGDWCNECPGFDKDDCFKLSDGCRKRWLESVELPPTQPTIEPRKKGKWISCENETGEGSNTYKCSACGGIQMIIDGTPKENGWAYCPHCGAKMDEGTEQRNDYARGN